MCYQPMHNRSFKEAAAEWKAEYAAWERGERPSYFSNDEETRDMEFWEYHGEPPDREYYRPHWAEGEATWYQVYQTVSEGSPVSPPFATPEELIDYLATYGDFWCQSRGDSPPSRESCERFVLGSGWVPSMVISNGGEVLEGISIAGATPTKS